MLAFARLPWFLALLLSIFLSSTVALADQTWTEIRSPRFRVVTDGSAKDGRMVGPELVELGVRDDRPDTTGPTQSVFLALGRHCAPMRK